MTPNPADSKPSELDQAAADRRSFGNPGLAANAEFKVIAEAMRELVAELRLIRRQVDKLVAVAAPPAGPPLPAHAPAPSSPRPAGTAG
jgi:hypothetical protein